MPQEKSQVVAAIHAPNLVVVSSLSFFNKYLPASFLLYIIQLAYFHSFSYLVHSGKELCDLYRYFQGAYFSEVVGHSKTKETLTAKDAELKTITDE